MLHLDHVLIAMPDLGDSVTEFETTYGLRSVAGGNHPGWGTANRIVPLGDCYLELVAVVDPARAALTEFGSWVARATPGRAFGWAVRTDDLDAVAERLGLPIGSGARVTPAGAQLRWRIAGVAQAAAEPWLPFFIEWAPGARLPGEVEFDHPGVTRGGAAGIQQLRIAGPSAQLSAWLDDDSLPIEVSVGDEGICGLTLFTPTESAAVRGNVRL